jgi:hypothetical protein
MDFQYKIDPSECRRCQSNKKMNPSPDSPYHVVWTLAPTCLIDLGAKKTSYVQTPVALIQAWIVSIEHPTGIIRTYLPIFARDNLDDIPTFEDFGHLLDHASAIFVYDAKWLYGMLTYTPFVVTDLDDLDLAIDWRRPWPTEDDPMVHRGYRKWWTEWMQGKTSSSSSSTQLLKKNESKQAGDSASAETTDFARLASVDPATELPRFPPFDDKHPDWEGTTDVPRSVWDWTVTDADIDRVKQFVASQKTNPSKAAPGDVKGSTILDAWRSVYTPSGTSATGLAHLFARKMAPSNGSAPPPAPARLLQPTKIESNGKVDTKQQDIKQQQQQDPPRLAPPQKQTKPPRLYFSDLRMRDWRARTFSLSDVIHKARPISFAQIAQLNQSQSLMNQPRSFIARSPPLTTTPTLAAASSTPAASASRLHPRYHHTATSSSATSLVGPFAKPLPHTALPVQNHPAFVGHHRYVEWYKRNQLTELTQALRLELQWTVDIAWCVYMRGMRLLIPDLSYNSSKKKQSASSPYGPSIQIAAAPLGSRFPFAKVL